MVTLEGSGAGFPVEEEEEPEEEEPLGEEPPEEKRSFGDGGSSMLEVQEKNSEMQNIAAKSARQGRSFVIIKVIYKILGEGNVFIKFN
jgi:hypothetical protein